MKNMEEIILSFIPDKLTIMNFYIIAIILWSVTGVYWIIAALNMNKAKKKEELNFRVFYMILWVLPFLLTFSNIWPAGFLYTDLFTGQRSAIVIIGFIGLVTGLLFMIWARVTLGKNWSGRIAIKENHQFIDYGPYAYARHPMYTGFIFAFTSSAFILGEVRGFIAAAILIVGVLVKMSKEEKFVTEVFGNRYVEYAKKVKRLIPFIY
jgi:protein-S-isoprenylcysteine O-methyltransferase Ste14